MITKRVPAEPSGVRVLHRLGRSVNDVLATAGEPVGEKHVRRQSACPNRSLITDPQANPSECLKKDIFVEDMYLCTGTKNRQFLSSYSRWELCSSAAKVLSFGFIRSWNEMPLH